MSGDEVVVLVASILSAFWFWGAWYIRPTLVRQVGRRPVGRRLLQVTPLAAAGLLWLVLKNASAEDVRDDPTYLTFYLVFGAAWVGFFVRLLAVAGISTRDDVVERANASASIAVAGAMLAITLCYAGGNIGDGPGWWVVAFAAGLATLALFAAWMLLELISGVSDVVTVDRDAAAAVRLAGFLVACGVILGRSVAGDWVSAEATVRDFVVVAWPVLVLVGVAAVVERVARPTMATPRPPIVPYGFVPAALYVAAAIVHVQRLGIPV
jgi:hypothetical protein